VGEAPPPEVPMQPDLDPGWNEFNPGGETACARDTPYAYWATLGTQNKIVIDFFGGGACWNDTTCSIADSIFQDSVDPIRAAIDSESYVGIYDRDNPANPFRDWHHVVIPYCTGDIHWGNARTRYGPIGQSFEIAHVGATNSIAVLDWVFANFAAPEQIFVTGCSAGSYGSALWSSYLMEHYPGSEVFQFGDSGAGVITESFFEESFPSWNASEAFPVWIPELDPGSNDIMDKALPDLYAGIANHSPGQIMSQYNTYADETQVFYFEAMGGTSDGDWTGQMLDSIAEIESRAENFCSFTAPGDQHCILTRNDFYNVESNGVLLIDWLGEMLGGSQPDSVMCVDCAPE
jgi:hypothetical protein